MIKLIGLVTTIIGFYYIGNLDFKQKIWEFFSCIGPDIDVL